MPSQEDVEENSLVRSNSQAELDLFAAIAKKDIESVLQVIRSEPKLNLNCVDKDDLTPLQHAARDIELARILINNGADVNFTSRKDGYTALMFAAISGNCQVVRLLLERGVNTTVENCVHRTAAQMAAFVGQSKIVSIINCWIPYETSIGPYTRPRQLEDEPRIPTKPLGHLLHDYIVYPSYHPVKFILFIKDNIQLVEHGSKFLYVLDDLCSKSVKPPQGDETLGLKYHYLAYLLRSSIDFFKSKCSGRDESNNSKFDSQLCSKALETFVRKLIKRPEPRAIQPVTPQIDRLITECLYKFPYTNLRIYNMTNYALGNSEMSERRSYSVLTTSLNGPSMFTDTSEACSICIEVQKTKKCSRCKEIYYCGPSCQSADWFQHKKVCKNPEEVPLLAPNEQAQSVN